MISLQNQQRQTFGRTGISAISLADRLAELLCITWTAGRFTLTTGGFGGMLLSLSGFLRTNSIAVRSGGILLSLLWCEVVQSW